MSPTARNKSSLDWGLRPQSPEVFRFDGPEWALKQEALGAPPAAFPAAESVARVAPQHCPIPSAQVSSVLTQTALHPTRLQPTVNCQIGSCLTQGSTSEPPAPPAGVLRPSLVPDVPTAGGTAGAAAGWLRRPPPPAPRRGARPTLFC